MISSHSHGLRSTLASRIPAFATIFALACVPAANTDDGTGDSGSVSATETDPTDPTLTGSATETSATADDSTGSLPDVEYMADIQPIWDENCVTGVAGTACHQMGGSWATNDLTPANSYENLMTADALESLQPFVVPSDLDGSYLWHKINGTWMGPPANGVCCDMPLVDGPIDMPMDPGPLPAADIEKIESWIVNGALP